MRRAAVSIDLDGIGCYYRIHALGPHPVELEHAILERALPRAAALFANRGLHVTWFVVGRDVDGHAANAQRLKTLADAGDEIGNHSYSHHYDLARMSAGQIDGEIARADRVLRTIAPVRGFRAPGYDVSAAMLDSLAKLGYRYDSSVFPAPAYYAAKAAVMAALAAAGRPSGAVLTNPRALTAPAEPYRPSMTAPWRRGQAPIVELPVAVTPWTRVPAIGTSLLVAPALWRRAVRLTVTWGFGLAGTATLALLAFGDRLIAVITTAQDVRALAEIYLPWTAFTALSGVLAFEMDGVFIGATWSRDMRNMMLLSFLVFVAVLATLTPVLGNTGLWIALHVFLLTRGFSLLAMLPGRTRTAF